MSHHKKANQVAPTHLAEPHHRAAFKTAPLSGVRWTSALGQAVAKGARQAVGTQRVADFHPFCAACSPGPSRALRRCRYPGGERTQLRDEAGGRSPRSPVGATVLVEPGPR
jgi:hypothetical protein